jgi:hypothetical protein
VLTVAGPSQRGCFHGAPVASYGSPHLEATRGRLAEAGDPSSSLSSLRRGS